MIMRPMQLSLLTDSTRTEGEICLACQQAAAHPVLSASTFEGFFQQGGHPAVSVEMQCDACGSSVLLRRRQESRWIRQLWGLR